MEELKLEDLDFGGTPFDVLGGDAKPSTEEVVITPPVVDIEKNKPDSEEKGDPSPESVATGKDNQDQTGKSPDGTEANSSSPQLNDSELLYSKLATEFITKGVLSDLDPTEVKSLEDISEALQKQVEARLTDRQKAIEEAKSAGIPVAKADQQLQVIADLESFTEADILNAENVELRKNLIAQDFVNRGYPDARAGELAQRSIDNNNDKEDAKFALSAIIKFEKDAYQADVASAKQKETEKLNNIKTTLADPKSALGDIKLTEVQQAEVFKQMTTDTGQGSSAFMDFQRANPIEARVKLETIFYVTKGLTDFSIFGQAAKTSNAQELEALLKKNTSFAGGGGNAPSLNDTSSNFSLKDFANLEVDV